MAQAATLAKTGGSIPPPLVFGGAGAIALGLTAAGAAHLARD